MHTETRESVTLENKGQKIFGILHRPVSSKNTPAVLFCQGFGGNKCGKLDIYVNLAKELASRGVSVLRFDYRGNGDSEGDSKELVLQDKVEDALLALRFLHSDPCINKEKIGLFGRSLGGAIGLLAAREFLTIRSFVLWAPVFSGNQWLDLWKTMKQDPTNEAIGHELKRIPGEIPNEGFLKQLFALNMTEPLKYFQSVPLLHIHGVNDQVVKIDHADAYQNVCQGYTQKKFIKLEKTNHDFAFAPERQIAEKETIDWFTKTLN